MIPNASDAKQISFFSKSDGRRATPVQVEHEFHTIYRLPKGKPSSFYAPYCTLIIKENTIDSLYNNDIRTITNQLRNYYPKYNNYPDELQMALLDMAFTLGAKGVTDWTEFNKALNAGNWVKAATESYRKDCGSERNTWVKNLLLKLTRKYKDYKYKGTALQSW